MSSLRCTARCCGAWLSSKCLTMHRQHFFMYMLNQKGYTGQMKFNHGEDTMQLEVRMAALLIQCMPALLIQCMPGICRWWQALLTVRASPHGDVQVKTNQHATSHVKTTLALSGKHAGGCHENP